MEKTELYELIESYLDDALPVENRRDVEQRMAEDKTFRQEVELHRELQQNFNDPVRWRLRSTMQEIMQEPLPPPGGPPPEVAPRSLKKLWNWWTFFSVVLFVGAGIWYFNTPLPLALVPDSPKQQPGKDVPTPPANKELEPSAPPTETNPPPKPKENKPIAMTDPANFAENPSMEALIKGVRGSGFMVKMTSPQNGDRFNPKPTGKTDLHFAGTVEGAPANGAMTLNLLIFNNKDGNHPLMTLPLQLTANAEGKAAFRLWEQVDFLKGLFYFRIEEKETGETTTVGKFLIGRL